MQLIRVLKIRFPMNAYPARTGQILFLLARALKVPFQLQTECDWIPPEFKMHNFTIAQACAAAE